MENVVVLPAPFGPSRPTTSPEAISRLTLRTTVRPPKDFVSSRVRSVAIQRRSSAGHAGSGLVSVATPAMAPTLVLSSARR